MGGSVNNLMDSYGFSERCVEKEKLLAKVWKSEYNLILLNLQV